MGFSPVELPLSEIVPVSSDVSTLPNSFDVVAVTSANAIIHASPALLAALSAKTCFAVGARTAGKAREAGFGHVEEGQGDAAALARLIAERLGTGARIVFPCGRVRLSELENLLGGAGLSVFPIETYDSRRVNYDSSTLGGVLGGEPIDAVLLYSAKAAEHFSGLAWSQAASEALRGARFLCMSARVAGKLGDVPSTCIEIASEPTEDALLRLLGAPARLGQAG
jgi:uroporphyrinogen-III synthase